MSTSRSSQRSSTSPFRSRKGSGPSSTPKQGSRPTTPVSSSRPPASSRLSPVYHVGYPGVEAAKPKESVTVTVRFRPLNAREINKGDEIAWYADGDYIVQNEYNSAIAYRYDKVFGPATTTRQIYDVAAQHVVSSAMEGINGTVFAYGVTSSGKTHTMHGDQKSPGIIPLAVKDVFSIIQETPGREFLLRVSYLEIYNEVINDLLDPAGQNLRIREDSQGIYVEGIKEEVVLSPAHALSLIASGEEHRHVGSNNFNLMSSRSHTIFTMTIESSPMESQGKEDVILSQLNLIDLAGSESSKTETTGLRRKEGSYINKSLLTLGTVIAKLTDSKATHVPYRDSKLTRLLQSSLSGHGRVSLICTVTPASSNSEETHNTLKFADRSKHVEIKAAQNKILDEKSLIKKYQKEISSLRRELQQLKERMMQNQYVVTPNQEDLVSLKLQFEAGQVKLQTRLEEEEQAKAALMGRIQRLTKLILVSTKNSLPSNIPEKAGHRRRHSFRDDELAYLPDRKREHLIDDDDVSFDSEFSTEGKCDSNGSDEFRRTGIKNRKRGMLGWFKLRKPEHSSGLTTGADSDSNVSGSTSCSQPLNEKIFGSDVKAGRRRSLSSFSDITQAGDLFSVATTGRHPQLTVSTVTDQMDLISEQMKMLAGEVALCTSSLKRVSEQASTNPQDLELQGQIRRLNNEISEKKFQMHVLEQRIIASFDAIPHASNNLVMSEALSKLAAQFNEKTFEHEIVMADNRILQDQLQQKISKNAELQKNILMLRQQLDSLDTDPCNTRSPVEVEGFGVDVENQSTDSEAEACENIYNSTSFLSDALSNASSNDSVVSSLKSQVLMQAAEIEILRQELLKLSEEKNDLEIHSQKLSEEASYAKELASAAAVELKNLAEEVTKLSYQNSQLTADLAMSKKKGFPKHDQFNGRHGHYVNTQTDASVKGSQDATLIDDMEKELAVRCQIEASLMATISEKDRRESELQRLIEEAREREEKLENELANMWIHISKGNKSEVSDEIVSNEDTTELHKGAENKPDPGNTLGGQYCEDRSSVTNNGNDERAVKQSRTAYEDEKEAKKWNDNI